MSDKDKEESIGVLIPQDLVAGFAAIADMPIAYGPVATFRCRGDSVRVNGATVPEMRWKHRMVAAMCDKHPEEPAVIDPRLIALRDSMHGGPPLSGSAVDVVTVTAGESDEPARGDIENRDGDVEEVQASGRARQAEGET